MEVRGIEQRVVEMPSSRDSIALHNGETRSLQLEGFESDMRMNFLKNLGGVGRRGQESNTAWGTLAAGFKAPESLGSDTILWAPTG